MKLKKVFPIVAMLLIVLMAGCKKVEYTDLIPAVTSPDPLNNVTGVPPNKKGNGKIKQQFTFVWISDMHVGDAAWQAGEIDAEVAAINSKNADFVLSSGDQIHITGDQTETDSYNAAMSVLTMPLYTLRGNHDGSQFTQHFIVDILNVRLIAFYASYVGLYSPTDPYYNTGLVSSEELTWIETQLQSAGNKRCILICHYPLSSSFWGYIQPGYGAEEIIALCNLYGVKLFLSGHSHDGLQSYVVDADIINIDAYAMVGAGKFMVCTVYSDRIVINPYNGTAPFAPTTPVQTVYF